MSELTPNPCAAALAEVLAEISGVQKDATLQTGKFKHDFRSKESLFQELRPRLAAKGIFPAVTVTSHDSNGDFVRLLFAITFHHGASGSQVVTSWAAEAADSFDKATSKAFTMGLRTFFDNQFMIGSDDTPNDQDYNNQNPEGRRTQQQSPPKEDAPPATLKAIGRVLKEHGYTPEQMTTYVESWGKSNGHEKSADIPASLISSWLNQARKAAAADLKKNVDSRLEAEAEKSGDDSEFKY